jgi:hypothetical protein
MQHPDTRSPQARLAAEQQSVDIKGVGLWSDERARHFGDGRLDCSIVRYGTINTLWNARRADVPYDFIPGSSIALNAALASGLAEMSKSGKRVKEKVAVLAKGGVAERSSRRLTWDSFSPCRRSLFWAASSLFP